jgi:hypothetical protein
LDPTIDTMNIASILRHWFTLLATLVTAWILGMVTLSPDDQAILGKAVSDLVGPLVIVVTLVITALWRVALAWLSTFRRGSGNHDDEVKDERGGGSGGISLLLVTGAAVGIFGSLPSCSHFSPPVGIAVQGPGYAVSYQISK